MLIVPRQSSPCAGAALPANSNASGRSGGAILASGIVSLEYCVFVGNQAGVGSAVTNTVSVSFSFVDFINNTRLCDDSALFLDWNDVSELENYPNRYAVESWKGYRWACTPVFSLAIILKWRRMLYAALALCARG